MVAVTGLAVVTVAGLVTALATGLGALPFFLFEEISDRWNVVLWGLSSGIMASASTVGLIREGLAEGTALEVGAGIVAGVALVVVARGVIADADIDPREYEDADFRKLALLLGVLTVHSFPEGVAIGVSFADLGLVDAGGIPAGVAVPPLAIFMTVAISIHNVPEGTAISVPLRAMGVPERRMVLWSVFSSLPQPIGAAVAFGFVRTAQGLLPLGFGFAAGAMLYLVATEFVPEALALGEGLPRRGLPELVGGIALGAAVMAPLALL